ncbi:dephospho-CoA kinase [Candidatus Desantisbacteria bacterium]|nr:dephospho-CoA kinase [Candidatus Desantisbacteria bacterium]
MSPQSLAWQEIINTFGDIVLNPDLTINRQYLGELIFSDTASREKLNQITHPLILKEIAKQIQENNNKIVIIDAPLLIEAGMQSIVDKIIVVRTSRITQIKRLELRDHRTDLQIRARIDSQISLEIKIEKADYIIDNNDGILETNGQIKRIWEELIKHDEEKTSK